MSLGNGSFSAADLNVVEYGRIHGDQPYNSDKFNIRIPKLMIRANTSRIAFNRNIFVNAPACAVSVKSSINTIDYITVKRSLTCDFSSVKDTNNNIPNGTVVLCIYVNGEIVIIDAVK